MYHSTFLQMLETDGALQTLKYCVEYLYHTTLQLKYN